jgi:aminoglycoside phosphotransferase (APT) family kinase protein
VEVNRDQTDIGQYEALLGAYFPELPLDRISLLGEGWDSIAIEVNHAFVFRIPKRPAVARQMCKEIRVLEAIRPYVKARIPLPEWIGAARRDFSVSVVGYRKLLGTPLSEIPSGSMGNRVLSEIGNFLSELHTIPKGVLKQADVPWFRWTGDNSDDGPRNWREGLQKFMDRIRQDVIPLLRCPVRPVVIDVIEDFFASPQNFQFEPVLLHGDLAAEHILVNTEAGEIGVIDFGDCGMGDPAYDVWPELTPFYDGPVDELFCARQRFYRKLAPFHGVLHGLLVCDEGLVTNALRQMEAEFA